MNVVVLMGRLTKDPETRCTQSGMAVTRYTLAVDRPYKKDSEQTVDFINCIVFDKGAEFAEKYFTKGMRVTVTGRIQTGSYTAKDGHKVYTTEVLVNQQEFAESKSKSDPKEAPKEAPKVDEDGFMNVPKGMDEELPFN